jgi:hypothetical protein
MKGSYRRVLKNPRFTVFFFGQTVSSIGDTVYALSTMWIVLTATRSPLAASVIPLIPWLASSFLSVPLATVADYLPCKLVLVGTDVLRALVVGGIVFMVWLHHVGTSEIYITNLTIEILGLLFSPAVSGVLPNLLASPSEELPAANALTRPIWCRRE